MALNPSLLFAIFKGGKALVMSPAVRLALARFIISGVKKNIEKEKEKKVLR